MKPGMKAVATKIELDCGLYDVIIVTNLNKLDELVAAGVKPGQILLSSELSTGSEISEVWKERMWELRSIGRTGNWNFGRR